MLGAVATVTLGPRAKPLPSSGCPANKPKFCGAINTCVPGRMQCVNANPKQVLELQEEELQEEVEEVEEEVEEELEEVEVEELEELEEEVEVEEEEELEAEVEEEELEEEVEEEEVVEVEELEEMEKRSVRIPGLRRKRETRIPGERRKRDEDERRKAGNNNIGEELEERGNGFKRKKANMMIAGRERRETEEIEKRGGCSDKAPASSCARMTCSAGAAKIYCTKYCGLCNEVEENAVPPADLETRGNCARPTIPNGRARNPAVMKPGDALKVQCAGGYTLVGETVKCQIANVFTNADKDARLFPQCIRVGGNTLVGNGERYQGNKNTFLTQVRFLQ